MTPIKVMAVMMIIIGIGLPILSFTSGSISPAELSVQKTYYEVTPGSTVVVNFDFYETFTTRDYTIQIVGNGIDISTPKVSLAYDEMYHGSLSFTAPQVAGTYTYKTHTYMYSGTTQVELSYDVKTITVVVKPQQATYTLTTIVQNENGNPISGAEVSINTGVIGTTSATGTVTKTNLIGSYTVTATKSGYDSASSSANMIQDQTIILVLNPSVPVSTPTPTSIPTSSPTPTPTFVPTSTSTSTPIPTTTGTVTSTPTVTGTATTTGTAPITTSTTKMPITYTMIIEVLDSNDPQKPIEKAQVSVSGRNFYTNAEGKISFVTSPKIVNVVITKDGYNTFQKSYDIDNDLKVKVTLPKSGGQFFLNLNLVNENPFYDPNGIFGTIPNTIAIISVLFMIVGVFLFMKKEK